MKRNALLTLVCCLVMGALALVAAPRTAMAIPYHATDSELVGTAYAVLNPTTGELDFVRSTETHEDESTGTVTSISGGTYAGTVYKGFENASYWLQTAVPWSGAVDQVKAVRFVDAVRPASSLAFWFYGMKGCTAMDLARLDTSQATDMTSMFYGCSSLTSLDLSSFDTAKVTSMSIMFYGCSSLTSLDVSSFDTSQVTDMDWMFNGCKSLTSLDLSSFDTSKVTNMGWMFQGCSKLTSLDLSSFDTSQVTDMDRMFSGCASLNKITFGDKFVIN